MRAFVPSLFLLAASAGALFTLSALRPARRFWPLIGAGFFASWLTGELVVHHLFWQAAATAAFVWAGGLDAWPGAVALGVVGASWAGLAVIAAEARRARDVMEQALQEGLGARYRDAIAPDRGGQIDEPWSLRQRLLPLPVYDPRVERVRDIVFSRAGGVTLRLDVYRPRGARARCPTVLHLHGGGWMLGSKDEPGRTIACRLAAHGWVCVSANYRLSPRATFPNALVDVKAAIRWIREHGAEYGADPDFLAITGQSAGGHLAALAALTPNDPEYQPGFEHVDTSVQACVPFCGIYDFTDRRGLWKGTLLLPLLERHVMKRRLREAREAFDRASPESRVRADAPPFLIVHGTRDTLVPVVEARAFVEALRGVSRAPVVYAEVPGAQHAFEVFPSARTGHVLRGMERFLAWVISRRQGERAGERETERETEAEARPGAAAGAEAGAAVS